MKSSINRLCLLLVVAVVILASASPAADACSTFRLKAGDRVLFAKNYDWNIGYGMLVTNKRNVAKTAQLELPDSPARWVSRYGSLTFNQFGREFPCGGFNEAGLAIEIMWLDESRYPKPDDRPALGTLSWIQYHLDTCATVEDVIESSARVRIASNVPVHFLVCDRSGATASFEYLDGELVCHEGTSMPVPVLTNDTYARSLAYLERHEGFGGTKPIASGYRSLDRFVRACALVERFSEAPRSNPIAYAFDALQNVAQGSHTKWSIVYDLSNLTVSFRSHDNRRIKRVRLADFDLSCSTSVKILDVNADLEGDVTNHFDDYTRAANRALIERTYRNVEFLATTPAALLDELAAFPESTPCAR